MGAWNKMTQKDFEDKIYSLVGDEYAVVGEYKGSKNHVDIKHIPCGTIISFVPEEFYRGRRCWTCWKKSQNKTTDWFIEKVKLLTGSEYTVVGTYVAAKKKVMMLHNTCGYKWLVTPDNFLRRNSRCPMCNKNARMTTEQFKQRMLRLIGCDYVFSGRYYNAHTKILCTHTVCGNSWKVVPDSIVQGTRCPFCNESSGERAINKYLRNSGISYIYQKRFSDCRYKHTLPFDFYLDKLNLVIEYDGIQHFKPVDFSNHGKQSAEESFKLGKKRDTIKNNYCLANKINILRIPYTLPINKIPSIIDTYLHLIA